MVKPPQLQTIKHKPSTLPIKELVFRATFVVAHRNPAKPEDPLSDIRRAISNRSYKIDSSTRHPGCCF